MNESGVICGDCRDVLPTLASNESAASVCDPPYELGFMGKVWDRSGVAFDPATWAAVLRVLKPGGYMLAMGGTRTYHRLTCAVEDAGFEIRDCLMWMYGTGFPKGQGCLKPAWEPILLARKPGKRVLPLGIDACRVPTTDKGVRTVNGSMLGVVSDDAWDNEKQRGKEWAYDDAGRYPANVLHDGSDEVMEAFAAFGDRQGSTGGTVRNGVGVLKHGGTNARPQHADTGGETMRPGYGDTGTAARFFYCAKASKAERGAGNTHPTVKPLALMRWLVRLVTPPGGLILDPFAGSGTTLVAAALEGREAVGIEQDAGHCATARRRLAEVNAADGLFAEGAS